VLFLWVEKEFSENPKDCAAGIPGEYSSGAYPLEDALACHLSNEQGKPVRGLIP